MQLIIGKINNYLYIITNISNHINNLSFPVKTSLTVITKM